MDTDTLVENVIDDGQRLVEDFLLHGFEVAAAFWLKASEDGKWYFYVVSPVVDAEGIAKAYRLLHSVVRAMTYATKIDPLKIKLIGANNPIAKDVMAIHGRAPGPGGSPVRWGGKQLGNVTIDEAYLYPLPATTP
jgi:hypothetical protein